MVPLSLVTFLPLFVTVQTQQCNRAWNCLQGSKDANAGHALCDRHCPSKMKSLPAHPYPRGVMPGVYIFRETVTVHNSSWCTDLDCMYIPDARCRYDTTFSKLLQVKNCSCPPEGWDNHRSARHGCICGWGCYSFHIGNIMSEELLRHWNRIDS